MLLLLINLIGLLISYLIIIYHLFQLQDANIQPNVNDSVGMEQYYVSQNQKYQPGTYPQLKRSSLSNIPIYENIDGYPDVVSHQMIAIQQQQQQQQAAIYSPPPPPYTAPHTIVSSDSLSKRNSRYT